MLYARHFPIRYGKMRVIDSCWRAAIGNRDTSRLAALNYGGFTMPCDITEMLQRQFYFFGTYFVEADTLQCWQTVAKHSDVVLDVGANAGIYSLAALAANPRATVYAFEPTPEIAARLRATVQQNGLHRLHVQDAAVFSKTGFATLKRYRGDFGSNEGMNFISESGNDAAEWVSTVTIDDFCREHSIDRVDLLKLDIQGHEHSALLGAKNMVETGRVGILFLELNWAGDAGVACPASESVHLLEDAGYRFSKPGKRLNWQESGPWLRNLNEVVAISNAYREATKSH